MGLNFGFECDLNPIFTSVNNTAVTNRFNILLQVDYGGISSNDVDRSFTFSSDSRGKCKVDFARTLALRAAIVPDNAKIVVHRLNVSS